MILGTAFVYLEEDTYGTEGGRWDSVENNLLFPDSAMKLLKGKKTGAVTIVESSSIPLYNAATVYFLAISKSQGQISNENSSQSTEKASLYLYQSMIYGTCSQRIVFCT